MTNVRLDLVKDWPDEKLKEAGQFLLDALDNKPLKRPEWYEELTEALQGINRIELMRVARNMVIYEIIERFVKLIK